MTLSSAVDLVVCGVFVAGLCALAQHLQGNPSHWTLFGGLAGGALCAGWGLLGRRRAWCRKAAMITLAAIACAAALEGARSWKSAVEGASAGRMAAALMGLAAVFCAGMLVNQVQEGRGQ